ncbi:MAG: hypothetical protein MJZ66_09885 [Bacteroidales bacterium]|nr:hypothetical protein [Bacteroidales bacterium]
MKKLFFTLVLALMAFVSNSFAQNLTSYSWASGIGFGLPEGMEIKTNTNEKFVATNNDDFAFSIVPVEFEKVKGRQLGKFVAELAFDNMGMDSTEGNYTIEEIQVTNGAGVYILGVDGDGTLCISAVFLSSVSNKGCFIFEAFSEEHAEEAGMVMGSVNFTE